MIRSISHFKSLITTVAVLFFLCSISYGQEIEALESERDRLINDIKQTNQLLRENQKKSGNVNHQYQLIQSQIRKRENLINTYNKEINQLNHNLIQLSQVIKKEESKLSHINYVYCKQLYKINQA